MFTHPNFLVPPLAMPFPVQATNTAERVFSTCPSTQVQIGGRGTKWTGAKAIFKHQN